MVLIILPNHLARNRTAIVAGRSVGGAVQRNLAKRRLRSAFQSLQANLQQGYDLVVIARRQFFEVDYQMLVGELRSLLEEAGLMKDNES